LRRAILTQREQLSAEEQAGKSRAIAENLWRVKDFAQAATVLFYVNFRREVITRALIRQCLHQDKRVTVPLTVSRPARLIPYVIQDPDRDLHPGYCGIPEPDPDRQPVVDPQLIDVVIVPGSVFDLQGGRLGYGGGYYDRFLTLDAPQACRIGLAYELQVVDVVPLLAHDQKMQILVTEKRIINF